MFSERALNQREDPKRTIKGIILVRVHHRSQEGGEDAAEEGTEEVTEEDTTDGREGREGGEKEGDKQKGMEEKGGEQGEEGDQEEQEEGNKGVDECCEEDAGGGRRHDIDEDDDDKYNDESAQADKGQEEAEEEEEKGDAADEEAAGEPAVNPELTLEMVQAIGYRLVKKRAIMDVGLLARAELRKTGLAEGMMVSKRARRSLKCVAGFCCSCLGVKRTGRALYGG